MRWVEGRKSSRLCAMDKQTASDKWITGLEAQMPGDAAARHVLEARMSLVDDLLAKARKRAGEAAAPVHQLRVATRRAEAALDSFRSFVKGSRRKKMTKHLKRCRRAAADVRMCDVHLGILRKQLVEAPPAQQAALEHVIARTTMDRSRAQDELDAVAARYRGKALRRRVKKLLDSISDRSAGCPADSASECTLSDIAREALERLTEKFREVGSQDLSSH